MQPAPQAQQGPNRPNPYVDYYNRWMDTTPYVTRASMIGIVAIYIFSFIIDLTSSLANVPYYAIFKIQLYRIILSPLVSNSILTIILIALFYPSMASRMENALGSTCFLCLICTLSILTNILFDVTSIMLFYMGVSSAIGFSCAGFWTVIFSLITIECMAQPELPRRMLFIPVDIPSKYFPLVLYAFFALFSGLELGFLIAIAVGYMYSKGFLDKFKLSSNYVDQLETSGGFLHSVSRQRGWVLTGLAQGPEAWIPANPNVQRDDNDNNNSGSNGFGSVFGSSRNYQKLSTTDPASKDNNKQDIFPGRGHTLASAPPISAQDAKEKRLAMLTGNNKIAESSPVSNTMNDENIRKITEMGFSRVDAINALQHSGGDLDSAVMSLTA